MTVNKQKKCVRYRGSKTHGCGSMKKRRGAGNRGGKGMAGTGKRAQSKKPSIINMFGNTYLGKHGFKRPTTVRYKSVNIAFLEEKFDSLLAKGKIKSLNGMYSIDLASVGAGKLLGTGVPTRKYRIKADSVSSSAAEKIKAAGGEIVGEKVSKEAVEEK
ncbi:MAG: 50S ribosomal protein L15 [Nanoarchaeota archaeon]|nr:50S ribosomal protein L15 [Nanoarchaeota archaeon]